MKFAENVKQLRTAYGYTQKQLAEKLGIGQNSISEWETGKSRAEYENLIKLANIFDVTLDELFGRT